MLQCVLFGAAMKLDCLECTLCFSVYFLGQPLNWTVQSVHYVFQCVLFGVSMKLDCTECTLCVTVCTFWCCQEMDQFFFL